MLFRSRYRDPNGKIAILNLTEKLGDYTHGQGIKYPQKIMYGYALSSADRSLVCNNAYHFLGIRVQLAHGRGSGTGTDRLQVGVYGMRLGLGPNPTAAFNETTKRALVLRGNTTWLDKAAPSVKDEFDTR